MDYNIYIFGYCLIPITVITGLIFNKNNCYKYKLFYILFNLFIILYLSYSKSENGFFRYFIFVDIAFYGFIKNRNKKTDN